MRTATVKRSSLTNSILGGLLVTMVLALDTEACTSVMDYEKSCKGCVSQLVQSWKAYPKANCSSQHSSFQQCLATNKQKCLINFIRKPDNRTVHDIQQLFDIYSASKAFFCQNGMLLTLANYKPSDLSMCTPALFVKAGACAKKFQKRFSRNRGSPKMCRWFYKARKCMLKQIKRNCKQSWMTSYLKRIYEDPYNPYCTGNQDIVRKRVRKGSSGFGRCTAKSYHMKSRRCIVRFIHELQKKNGQRCRSIVSSVLIPCVKHCMKQCLKGTRDTKSLDKALTDLMDRRRTYMQNDNCEGSHLETLSLSKEQCSEEYFENFQKKCYSKFLVLYKKNRGNPQLCQHYSEVKRCARNMTLSMCKLDSTMKHKVQDLYGNFNPFCPNGRDSPNSVPLSQTHKNLKTPSKSNGMVHAARSVLTVATSIFVVRQILS